MSKYIIAPETYLGYNIDRWDNIAMQLMNTILNAAVIVNAIMLTAVMLTAVMLTAAMLNAVVNCWYHNK